MKARRLRKASVCGRVMTVKTIKKIMLVEKIFTIIVALALLTVMTYICMETLEHDCTSLLVVVPLTVMMIFTKYRIPLFSILCVFIDGDEYVYETKYGEYDRYFEYDLREEN